MAFDLIDIENWERREYYEHFIGKVVCSYSVTVDIDITDLKGQRLYPAMIWLLTQTVNEMPQFRTALTDKGLGIYDELHPMYTLFNEQTEKFSGIWAYNNQSYPEFLKAYLNDVEQYGDCASYTPKPGTPENSFNISMAPWVAFTSLNYNVYDEGKFLLPIFTMGKFREQNGKRLLPLAIQVHHAVCDGYHVGKFVALLQHKIEEFGKA